MRAVSGDSEAVAKGDHQSVDQEGTGGGPRVGVVAVHWRIFGSSFREVDPPGGVLRGFLLSSRAEAGVNQHVKTIARPSSVSKMVVHDCRVLRKGGLVVDTYGTPLANKFSVSNVTQGGTSDHLLRINHYHTKSAASLRAKIARGRPSTGQAEKRPPEYFAQVIGQYNDEFNSDIVAYIRSLTRAGAKGRRPKWRAEAEALLLGAAGQVEAEAAELLLLFQKSQTERSGAL